MIDCAIYARVSTVEQVKGYSIEAQLDTCRQYATAKGFRVVKAYVDPGKSGGTDNRPGFQAVIGDALAGQFSMILVHAFDRFSRNMEDAVVYKSLLRRDGIKVISVTEQVDDTPTGFIHEGIIDLFAAYYSINLSVKIRSGLTKAVRTGKWPWAVPMGYHKITGLAQISEQGPNIQMAFKEFATGAHTLNTWADAAYQAGLRGPKNNKIRPGGWSRIFHNQFYIGRLCWNCLEVAGLHEPLIDEETFNRVQGVLRANDRFSRPREHGFYLLGGLLWSLDANDLMTGARVKGRNSHYRYYRSRDKMPAGGGQHYVRTEVLEAQVEAALTKVTISPQDVPGLEVDQSMRLALMVGHNNLGSVYQWLDAEQRRDFLKLVIARYGLKISGQEIVDVEPKPPFCFWLDTKSVVMAGVELFVGWPAGVTP